MPWNLNAELTFGPPLRIPGDEKVVVCSWCNAVVPNTATGREGHRAWHRALATTFADLRQR